MAVSISQREPKFSTRRAVSSAFHPRPPSRIAKFFAPQNDGTRVKGREITLAGEREEEEEEISLGDPVAINENSCPKIISTVVRN